MSWTNNSTTLPPGLSTWFLSTGWSKTCPIAMLASSSCLSTCHVHSSTVSSTWRSLPTCSLGIYHQLWSQWWWKATRRVVITTACISWTTARLLSTQLGTQVITSHFAQDFPGTSKAKRVIEMDHSMLHPTKNMLYTTCTFSFSHSIISLSAFLFLFDVDTKKSTFG